VELILLIGVIVFIMIAGSIASKSKLLMKILFPEKVLGELLTGEQSQMFFLVEDRKKRFDSAYSAIVNHLHEIGFTISYEPIGCFGDGGIYVASYFMFVDEESKSFIIASPMDMWISKLYGFDELESYYLFDEDDTHWMSKHGKSINKGILAVTGAVPGMALGTMIGGFGKMGGFKGGFLGAAGGALGFSALSEFVGARTPMGVSQCYGLIIEFSGYGNDNLVLDFLSIYGTAGDPKSRRVDRTDGSYGNNVNIVLQMSKMLDEIYEDSDKYQMEEKRQEIRLQHPEEIQFQL